MNKRVVVLGGGNTGLLGPTIASVLSKTGYDVIDIECDDFQQLKNITEITDFSSSNDVNKNELGHKEFDPINGTRQIMKLNKQTRSYKTNPFFKTKEQLEIEEWNRTVDEKRQKKKDDKILRRIDRLSGK